MTRNALALFMCFILIAPITSGQQSDFGYNNYWNFQQQLHGFISDTQKRIENYANVNNYASHFTNGQYIPPNYYNQNFFDVFNGNNKPGVIIDFPIKPTQLPEQGVDTYLDGFPVIYLTEDEIRR